MTVVLATEESTVIEEKLENMELRLAQQEEMLDALNKTVYRQQKKLDEMESLCTALARYVKSASYQDSERHPVDEKPPHY